MGAAAADETTIVSDPAMQDSKTTAQQLLSIKRQPCRMISSAGNQHQDKIDSVPFKRACLVSFAWYL